MRLLTKMSAVGLGFTQAMLQSLLIGEGAQERVFVGRVFGVANGVKEYADKNSGELRYGLKGEFGGISALKNDEKMPIEDARSKVCYLPDVAQQDVISKICEIDAETGKPVAKTSIEFAFDIYAVAKVGSATGYVFDVDQLITVAENDPLANMFAKIEKQMPVAMISGPDTAKLVTDAKPAVEAKVK